MVAKRRAELISERDRRKRGDVSRKNKKHNAMISTVEKHRRMSFKSLQKLTEFPGE